MSTVNMLVMLMAVVANVRGLYEFPKVNPTAGISTRTINQLQQIDDQKLRKSEEMAERSINSSQRVETNILRSVRLNENTISYGQWLQGYPILEGSRNNYVAAVILKTSLYVLNKECREKQLQDADCSKYISTLSLPDAHLKDQCQAVVRENDKIGLQSYRRLLPPDYKDGLQSIRTSAIPRKSLPSARRISEQFYTKGMSLMQFDSNYQHPHDLSKQPNLILPQWSYFIEHDLAKTVIGTMLNGEPIECCSMVNLPVSPRHRHPACYPLEVTDEDSFYGQLGVTCLNYVRSALAVNRDCKLGPAEQLSETSGMFDLSQLYGYNANITYSLRSHIGGTLKGSKTKMTSLPMTDANKQFCMHNASNRACYMAGDPRINHDPYTTVIYAIFHKSHNQIASTLNRLNPHWTDDRLFQVARAINVGLYQKIIYTEWTTNVLGQKVFEQINAEPSGVRGIDDRVSNEFATAAIRFSNSMIPGDLFAFEDQMHGYYGSLLEPLARGLTLKDASKLFSLQDVFFKPKHLSKRKFARSVIKASFVQKALRLDTSYEDDLSSQLFRSRVSNGKDFGTDSLALDIQRGRDHGLSPYVKYVKGCQGTDISDWDDLKELIYEHDLTTMKSVYQTVADIDLIVGLLAEIPDHQSTLVGPTLACVLGEQISNSKRADQSFFTQNLGGKVLKTVDNYTGARLLCDTLDLESVPRDIFRIPSMKNLLVPCSDPSLSGLNFDLWKENHVI